MSTARIAFTVSQGTPIAITGWQLERDLAVEFEFAENYVIATNSWVDEYGQGRTKGEALEDLLTSLADLYDALLEQRQEAELADELQETLDKLESFLVKAD